MTQQRENKYFDSENAWPFLVRQSVLDDCLHFLSAKGPAGPRLLHLDGPSGSGKSFLTRELLVRYAEIQPDSTAVYIDSPPSDLEASDLFKKIAAIITVPRYGDRSSPNFVGKIVSDRWRRRKKPKATGRAAYLYGVLRELVVVIQGVGQIIKAFMPPALSAQEPELEEGDGAGALRYLLNLSRTQPVAIALDNVQFLPPSTRDMLDGLLQDYGAQLRLIVVERTIGGRQLAWRPAISGVNEARIPLGLVSLDEVRSFVNVVLPLESRSDALANAIFRRSEGNLKSVWFQLKLIADRRIAQSGEVTTESYENVIQSLRPADQLVLRLVVFVLGGLSITTVIELFKATHLGLTAEGVNSAISDLTALGLVIVNSERHDKVRVEHEIVSSVVTAITPEDEKLELRSHLVEALSGVLSQERSPENKDALYDRLFGIVHEKEVRSRPNLQSHLVAFINAQDAEERFTYLTHLCSDTVCWDVIDILPADSIRTLLNAIQKCSLFPLGLVATQKLANYPAYRDVAALFEAKYLVQLFRYDEANRSLNRASPSRERDAIEFNILVNLCEEERAAAISSRVFDAIERVPSVSEFDLVILRNSGHLFAPDRARTIVEAAVRGFTRLGSRFGIATSLNNLGIVDLVSNRRLDAKRNLESAKKQLSALGSDEIYQPLVNLSGLELLGGNVGDARKHISSAREFLPRSLVMDLAMLDFNEAILTIKADAEISLASLENLREIYSRASKTRDLRFRDLVGWFVAQIERELVGVETATYAESMIKHVRESGMAGIEVFTELVVANRAIIAPYILSPHWRY